MSAALKRRAPRSGAPMPTPPTRGFSFTDWQVNNPSAPPPGQSLDSEIDNTNMSVAAVITWANTSLNTDGTIQDATIGTNQLQPGLFDSVANDAIAQVQPLVDTAVAASGSALASANDAQGYASSANGNAIVAGAAAQGAYTSAQSASGSATTASSQAASAANGALNAANSANQAAGSEGLCFDYGLVTQAWAEHMPDTIPPNILAVMGITGDHWSSRWWANRAAQWITEGIQEAQCAVQQFWMGAYADNPTIDLCGRPPVAGAAYFNTTVLRTRAYDGKIWHDIVEPVPGVTTVYTYLPTTPQTVFSGPDANGNDLTISLAKGDLVTAYLNGIKLVLNNDYAVTGEDEVTLLISPIGAPAVVEFVVVANIDVIIPRVGNKIYTADWVFDGVNTVFPLVDDSGDTMSPASPSDCTISLDGLIQNPGVDYTVAGDSITFAVPPTADQTIWGVVGLAVGASTATDAVLRRGDTMTGPLQLPGGTANNPGLQLGASDGTGFSRLADAIVLSVQGTYVLATLAGAAQFYTQLSMLGNKIAQLADATAPADALNLRVADARYAPIAVVTDYMARVEQLEAKLRALGS
jgi:hypothetical protein